MRTAEEIMDEYGIEMQNFIASSLWVDVKMAINEARKEAIIECSKKVTLHNFEGKEYIDLNSILSIIDELK